MLLLAAGFIFFIISIPFGLMKSSDAYKMALARAKADPRVMNALGSPIEDGFFVGGNSNVSGTSGHADMNVPISGPKGKGTIYFVASKFAGQWTFSKLMVEVAKTGQRIDLIEDPATTVP
jgi:cytochrome oxidase complex assembly protein 1